VIVLDASAVVNLFVGLPIDGRLLARVYGATDAHAPHLIDIEFLSALRRLERAEEISPDAAGMARRAFAELPLERYSHELLRDRIWALRRSVTAYDAAYIALAEALDLPLITTDRRLAGAHGHRARIESFAR
jgi:predicted nucleic acid-binding protein